MSDSSKSYFNAVQKALDTIDPIKVAELSAEIIEVWRSDNKIIIFGNGGSAATASHFACDLSKLTIKKDVRRLKVMALTDNIPLITAWANDSSYERVFVEQLIPFIDEKDLIIAISGSGNSANVLRAVEFAKSVGVKTASLSGFKGGKIKDIADIPVIIFSDSMQVVEDAHSILCHSISINVAKILSHYNPVFLTENNPRSSRHNSGEKYDNATNQRIGQY